MKAVLFTGMLISCGLYGMEQEMLHTRTLNTNLSSSSSNISTNTTSIASTTSVSTLGQTLACVNLAGNLPEQTESLPAFTIKNKCTDVTVSYVCLSRIRCRGNLTDEGNVVITTPERSFAISCKGNPRGIVLEKNFLTILTDQEYQEWEWNDFCDPKNKFHIKPDGLNLLTQSKNAYKLSFCLDPFWSFIKLQEIFGFSCSKETYNFPPLAVPADGICAVFNEDDTQFAVKTKYHKKLGKPENQWVIYSRGNPEPIGTIITEDPSVLFTEKLPLLNPM